ncbi:MULTISPECIES: hypothetical protein [unclassified Pseudodesulfovibrio]|uniref:hypothetical protein n=1 Tax=unclassified Pseudodesulfovibrio TaxID=2661612 RepID=UPI001F4FC2D4|nr:MULTISPECIES: hypothetical protein [unclassified Pseudodesulfovibrio]MCJ2164348.1 hypothetical protein [Pseudodesulfovibrio sp. S3-i]
MNIRVLFFTIMLVLAFVSTSPAAEECKAIPWGAPISAVEEITFSHLAGGVKFYTVTKVEPCGIFKVQGAHVSYGFREGKLFTTLVEIDKAKDVKKVVSLLMDSYGLPDHKKSDGWDEYRWETEDLRIKLKSQYSTDRIKIGMYYKPLIPKE